MISRRKSESIQSIGIVVCAAVIVAASILATILLTLTTFAAAHMVWSDSQNWFGQGTAIGSWDRIVFLWSVGALLIAFRNAVAGVSVMSNPTREGLGLLVLLSVGITLTCPFLWAMLGAR